MDGCSLCATDCDGEIRDHEHDVSGWAMCTANVYSIEECSRDSCDCLMWTLPCDVGGAEWSCHDHVHDVVGCASLAIVSDGS